MDNNLLRFNFKQKFLIFDTETEGLNLASSRPYQLAYCVLDKSTVHYEANRFIKISDFKMTIGAARATSNTFDMAEYSAKALDVASVWNEFASFLFDPSIIVVCHNFFNFDVYMLALMQRMMGVKPDYSYLNRVIDTKVLAIAIKKGLSFDPNNPEENFLTWQYKVNSIIERGLKTNLQLMLEEFEIPFNDKRLHEALYDVQMLGEVFKKMIWKVEVPNLIV